MTFPTRFQNLPAYPFPRLRALLDGYPPGGPVLQMAIGEPRHHFPDWIGEVITANLHDFGRYPPPDATPELLAAMAGWVKRRFGASVTTDQLICTNGSREGLNAAGIALCPEEKRGHRTAVLMPNPFYQVYAAAAITAEAEPVFLPATAGTGFLPDFDAVPAEVLNRTALAYICSPANPQGAVASRDYYLRLLQLAEKHDFKVMADECYSEIWRDARPVGLLGVAHEAGADPERVVVFNSLSKRSSLPGLRCGMIVAGRETMARIRRLRSYGGAPVPVPLQRVAERLWADETHVEESRQQYVQKFDLVDRIFTGHAGISAPEGGFFLWLPVKDSEAAALKLWREVGVRTLPGAYLGRDTGQGNPGAGYLRVALVAEVADVERGLRLIRDCLL